MAAGLVLAALLVVAAPAGMAGAHATLQGTTPAADVDIDGPPPQVELAFDEPVSASTGAVQVIAPDGSRADRGVERADGGRVLRVAIDQAGLGTYTVAYRVVSDDGHTITGSFVFHAGARTGAAEIDQSVPLLTSAVGAVGRWLSYAGAVVAVGAALVLAATRAHGGPGPARGPLAALVLGGALAAGVGGDLAVLARTATTTGRSLPGSLSLVTEVAGDSRPVLFALIRSSVLLLAALVALAGRRRDGALLIAGGLAAVAGVLAPVAGHPWTTDPRALAVPADALHLLAASVWLGMVAALAAIGHRLPEPVPVVHRVATAGLVGAVVVAVSGAVSGALLLGSLDALFQTASGQMVVLKVIGFGGLVFLGWLNRVRLIPLLVPGVPLRVGDPLPVGIATGAGDGPVPVPAGAEAGHPVARAGEDDGAGGDHRSRAALATLLQVVKVEVVVGALVLVVTAALVNQPPGRDQLAQPFSGTAAVDGQELVLEVAPARAGDNEIHTYLRDGDGQPAPFDAMEIRAGRPDVPDRRLEVVQVTPDHAVAYGASLPTPGTWTLTVTTVHQGDIRQFLFEVAIR